MQVRLDLPDELRPPWLLLAPTSRAAFDAIASQAHRERS
jgi:hypothetical protein